MTLENMMLNNKDELFSDKKQIYIVDDDESICRSLKLLLVSYGFAVNTFSSAEEYFKVVPNSTKCCLVLDIHMPGLNGWDALKRLTEAGYNHPVIVITADKDESFREKALKAGAVGFLQKPFGDHYLLHMVTHIFNKQEIEMKKLDEQELEDIKQRIIDDKNKLLFGYMKSEEVIENFDQLKKQINEYSSSIEYYTKIFYDKVDNKADKEELNKLIADSYNSIQSIKDFLNGEEYEDHNVVSAVKVYVEQLKPQMDKIMRLKYKQNIVWYDEDTMTYHLIQSYQTISSLEVALVETKVMGTKVLIRENPKPQDDNEESESDSDKESGLSIGEEIQDESYESLD